MVVGHPRMPQWYPTRNNKRPPTSAGPHLTLVSWCSRKLGNGRRMHACTSIQAGHRSANRQLMYDRLQRFRHQLVEVELRVDFLVDLAHDRTGSKAQYDQQHAIHSVRQRKGGCSHVVTPDDIEAQYNLRTRVDGRSMRATSTTQAVSTQAGAGAPARRPPSMRIPFRGTHRARGWWSGRSL